MGTSPELRVHPLREILAPRPGMRFHACHTARAASDETDATTRDGGAMDAARFPDPTHDVPRDDRAHDRDDTRARALLERRRRRRYEALRRVGVCSSTPDRRRRDRERREDRDAHFDNRDDPRFDTRHDREFRAGREALRRARPDDAKADVARDLRRELERMTASRRAAAEAAAASSPSLTVSQDARETSSNHPLYIDGERRRRARRAATADAVARYRREVLIRMRIDDDEIGDDASAVLTAPARHLASCAIRVASRRERSEDEMTMEGCDDDARHDDARRERETSEKWRETSKDTETAAEKDAETAAEKDAETASSTAAPTPIADEMDARDGSAGAESDTDSAADDSGPDDSGADVPRARDSVSSYAEFVAAADADDALAAARVTRVRAPEPTFEPSHLESFPRASPARVASARLERAWRALRTPFAARVDAAIKFSTPPWRARFAEALDAWESAAAAVVARERSVVRLEALVARTRAGEDETPDADEIEAFADVESATRAVAKAAQTLRAFDETLCFRGTPYLAEYIARGA